MHLNNSALKKAVGLILAVALVWIAIYLVAALHVRPEGKIAGQVSSKDIRTPDILNTDKKSADEYILRLLVWEGYSPEKYVADFEQKMSAKYGKKVKLEIAYAQSTDDFYQGIRNKSVELVTVSHHAIKDQRFDFIRKKLILPFKLENIPNHTNLINDFQKAEFHSSNDAVYGVPIANGPYGLVYNTNKFEQEPRSWNVFWEPELKGKYSIAAHEYIYNVNITALALGYPRNLISNFDALNNKLFKDKLRLLAANAHSLWIGVDKADDLMGLSLATSWGDSLTALKRKGEIWKMAKPAEGTMWWIDEYVLTWALADKPILKKIAEEWINRGLQPDFQVEHLTREVNIYPVVTNIGHMLNEAEKERVLINTPGAFSSSRILQEIHSQRDRNGLKLLWEQAIKNRAADKKEYR